MGWEYPCEGTTDRAGLTPSAGPAVGRDGWTALTIAALNDDRPIVAALLGARAAVNTQSNDGCAFAVGVSGAWSAVADGAPMRQCPPRPAGGRRCTMRQPTAASAPPRSCSSAAPISASRTTTGNAMLRTSHADGHTPIGAGERLAKLHRTTASSARTTRRWRRRGRRIGAAVLRAPLAAAGTAVQATHANHALARRGMPRPHSSAYADAPAA